MFASRLTSLHARLAARLARSLTIAGVAALTLGSAACAGDTITAPAAPSAARADGLVSAVTGTVTGTVSSTLASLTKVSALTWSKPVSAVTATQVIGAAGGTLSIANGIRITVPKGAVSSNTTFSVTRLEGSVVAYDFQPHGTTFAVPLQIEQPTLGTTFGKWPVTARVRGAYFPQNSLLDQLNLTALVSEFRPTLVSTDKAVIKFTVDHFSGYMVSMD